jgi:hypothetical protein
MSIATVFQNFLSMFNSALVISIFGFALILLCIFSLLDLHERGYSWLIRWGLIGGIAVSAATIASTIL